MKKAIYFFFALMSAIAVSKAQTTAMDFSGMDCDGNMQHLFADLDAGKAVLLHFYMPNCGSCPPPAKKIQTMANHILANYPGMITAYAFPFNNTTLCSYSSTWVSSNALYLYSPMDSGAAQVAYYGGFGMPSVVLLGGTNHRVMFSTQSFSTSDTIAMRDSILNLLNPSGISNIGNSISSVKFFPNPATDKMSLELNILKASNLKIEVLNILGSVVSTIYEGKVSEGSVKKEIYVSSLNNGVYFVRVSVGANLRNYKFTVEH